MKQAFFSIITARVSAMSVTAHLVAIFLLVPSSCSRVEPFSAKAESDISGQAVHAKVSARDYVLAYHKNEVAADQVYEGRVLVLTGVVDSINKDISSDVYVIIKPKWVEIPSTQEDLVSNAGSVWCYFAEAHVGDASALRRGSVISVKGKGGGTMFMGNPKLEGCMTAE